MDFFNSLTQIQQILVVIVAAVVVFFVGSYLYKYFSQSRVNPPPNVDPRVHERRADPVTPIANEPQREAQGNAGAGAIFAFFYTDWCGYCKASHPAYDELMSKMDGYKGLRIVKVNCEENPELAALHNVKSYPTLILLGAGLENPDNALLYTGDRSVGDMTNFLTQNV